MSTDLTNEYLKQEYQRLPAQEAEYLWMSCFGAHMAALFVALDELLPYVHVASQDFTPYLARARNHAEAIDKAFRFRLASYEGLIRSSVCTVTKVFRTCCEPSTFSLLLSIWRQALHCAGVDEDVVVDAGVAAKVSTSDGEGRLSSELLEPCEAIFRRSLFAELCQDSENISPLEATTATVVRYVAWIGAHGSGFGQCIAGQPTGSGGAAERPDLIELAQSGRVGAKSVSAEDDYLAVPELLQRAESGYEAVRPVSRVHGLFPMSTDLTNEYLKHDDRLAQEEDLWMSCFGAHMAALFVALDELLPYVPATNQDFTPYLARARNHAEAIDKAFRFRLAFLRRLNEIKRVHARRRPLLLEWRLQLQVAGVGEDVAVDAAVAAKVSTSDGVGRLSSELLEPCEASFR
eukprot:jgi/Tetstr1/455864/TSEL_042653.t1